jgi:hypothetical protein
MLYIGLGFIVATMNTKRVEAQAAECPFPDSVAVADTLDAKLYYPLQVGNVWETTVSESGFELADPTRLEVIADTVIEDISFVKVRSSDFTYTNDRFVLTGVRVSHSYRAVVDTALLDWSLNLGLRSQPFRFNQSFNSCYESMGSLIEVSGGYDQSFSIREQGGFTEYQVPAIKHINFENVAVQTFAHGIGRVEAIGDPFRITELIYAKIDGVEYGTPLAELFEFRISSTETDLLNQKWSLSTYPNPVRSTLHVQLHVQELSVLSLSIYDLLGRKVMASVSDWPVGSGLHVFDLDLSSLAAGTYVLRVSGTAGERLLRKIIKLE